MLDGPPEAWIDQFADLALTHGISPFLIGGGARGIIGGYDAQTPSSRG